MLFVVCNNNECYLNLFPEQKKPTHAHIEKCLAKKWHGVPADNIGPLLARVVNIVVDLTSIF